MVEKGLPIMNYKNSARNNEKATMLAVYLAIGQRIHKTKQISLPEIIEGVLRAVRYRDRTEYTKASPRQSPAGQLT